MKGCPFGKLALMHDIVYVFKSMPGSYNQDSSIQAIFEAHCIVVQHYLIAFGLGKIYNLDLIWLTTTLSREALAAFVPLSLNSS